MSITLIFKNRDRKPGVAIRRPRDHEEEMATLIVPYDWDMEKEEVDYIMEGEVNKEQERIAKGNPISRRKAEKDAQAVYERRQLMGDTPIVVKPD